MIRDLPAYLRRIGFEGRPAPDLQTLRQLALRHPLAIAFENLDPWLGRAVSLVPGDVEDKLVRRARGGWCFEHNLLLGNALRAIGFGVRDLAARVLWRRDVSERTPRTHRLLEVDCEGRQWLVDAGFGGLSLTGILDLERRDAQPTPHEDFRLQPLDADLLLEAHHEGAWQPLYRFDRQPQWPQDFEAANFQLAHDPTSHFVTGLIVARPALEGRCTLRDGELALRDRLGNVERRQIETAAELAQVLRDRFGIDGGDVGILAARFGRRSPSGG